MKGSGEGNKKFNIKRAFVLFCLFILVSVRLVIGNAQRMAASPLALFGVIHILQHSINMTLIFKGPAIMC